MAPLPATVYCLYNNQRDSLETELVHVIPVLKNCSCFLIFLETKARFLEMDYLDDLTLPPPCCYGLFDLISIMFPTAHSTRPTQLLNVSQTHSCFGLLSLLCSLLGTLPIQQPANLPHLLALRHLVSSIPKEETKPLLFCSND